MADYKRIAVVPGQVAGTSDKNPVIANPNNGGFNWALDYDGNIVKRPGSQTIYQLEDAIADINDASGVLFQHQQSLFPGFGAAFGGGVLLRTAVGGQVVQQAGASSTSTYRLPSEEIVLCGSEFFWRLIPVIVTVQPTTATQSGWEVVYDGTDKRFKNYFNDALITDVIIGWGTESSAVNFVALNDALTTSSATSIHGVAPTLFTQVAQQIQPAGFLLLGPRVSQGEYTYISTYVALRIANPYETVNVQGQPCPRSSFGVDDTNWANVQLNGALYFAGRKRPLLKYDGSHVYVPGALNAGDPSAFGIQDMFTSGGPGTFLYRLVHKVPNVQTASLNFLSPSTPPNVAFNFGVPYEASGTRHLASTFGNPIAKYGAVSGVDSASALSPQAFAPMTRIGRYKFNTVSGGVTKVDGTPHDLLPGDLVYHYDSAISTTVGTWRYVSQVTESNVTFFDGTNSTSATAVLTLDSVLIYRTEGGGDTYYQLAELPTYLTLSGGTYTDPGASIAANISYDEPTFTPMNAPSITSAIGIHQNRLIVAHDASNNPAVWRGATALARCMDVAVGEPLSDQFAADTGFTIEDSKAKEIRAIASVNDTLYLFTDRSVWYVQGDVGSAASFQVHLLTEAFGAASNDAVQVIDSTLWCLTSAGQIAVVTNGRYDILPNVKGVLPPAATNAAEISSRLSFKHATTEYDANTRRLLFHIPFMTPKVYRDRLAGGTLLDNNTVYYNDRLGLLPIGLFSMQHAAAVSMQDSEQSITYVLDFNHGKDPVFYQWKGLGAAGGLLAPSFGLFGVSREAGNSYSASRIFKFDDKVAHDQGVPFEMRFQSSWQDFGDVQHNKRPAKLQILSGTEETQNFSLSVKTEQDWLNNVFVDDFTASFKSGEGYAEQPYGTVAYGDANEPNKVFTLQAQRAKSIRLTLSNSDPLELPMISGWSYEIADNEKNTKET